MPSSRLNLKAAAWGWRSAVQSWNRMVAVCGPHPTTDGARRFISLCQPQSWKCLRQYDSEFLRTCDSRSCVPLRTQVHHFDNSKFNLNSDANRELLRSVHNQVSRSCWGLQGKAECSTIDRQDKYWAAGRILISSPNSSPNCAPKGLQFVLSAPLYSIDNIGSPALTTALLTEG